ncbi:MAG: hypothetical protein U1E05_08170 [Patescibacteria group bacterium]|nr:hypothetical protein [Patescibacteria group bacterium]
MVALGVVALLGLGVYFFIAAVIDKLNALNSDLGKAIVAGAVTVAAAIITLVVGKVWEQRVKIQQEVREKKVPVYEKQIETFFAVMFAQKTGAKAASPEELQKAFLAFTEKLIIWGSPEVIKAWSAFRLHDWQNTTPQAGFLKLEAFIRAIRADLGGSNSGLPDGELMRLFINDLPGGGSGPQGSAELGAAPDAARMSASASS